MTAADHANTVRELSEEAALALIEHGAEDADDRHAAICDAVDALQTQAEQSEYLMLVGIRDREAAEADAAHQRILRQDAEAERDRARATNDMTFKALERVTAERDAAYTDRDEYITIAERLQAERDLAVRQRDHAQDALRPFAGFPEITEAQRRRGYVTARVNTAWIDAARAALGDKP